MQIAWTECECGAAVFDAEDYKCDTCRARVNYGDEYVDSILDAMYSVE